MKFTGLIIFCAFSTLTANAFAQTYSSEEIKSVIRRQPEGQALLSKFENTPANETHELDLSAETSHTDAVISRKYNLKTEKESTTREVVIHLRQHAKLESVVLDLVHELVHAVKGGGIDPYDPELTADQYIQQTLEGAGGEVEAVWTECRFMQSMKWGSDVDPRCDRYQKELTKTAIRNDFYKVGSHKAFLERHTRVPVSGETPLFISSTGDAPYPLALFEEYQELTKQACRNAERRIASSREGKSKILIRKRCQ